MGVRDQCLRVVLCEVKGRWCNFYWSVAHHKLLILIEQSLQCIRLVMYLWIRHCEGLSGLSLLSVVRDHCRQERDFMYKSCFVSGLLLAMC